MKHCDLCHCVELELPLQRVAFGKLGVPLVLHPSCQRKLLDMPEVEQDQAVIRATHHNRKSLGRYFQ